ncbi:hypothetical protein LGN17_04040 [Burkholderia sp. AU30280]|uniref:hypothetical protein n=1 Tax=Burkholderia sp. AU30280 TaxID=2879628 RepID=UPI001CF2D17A|nr:hypothetical protein [Burkholderia sp. AU30280]MCA8271692.1 hypothetical protein [Burkholderia sp. AU30280]
MDNGNQITERCRDGRNRYTGAFNQTGDNVSATCRLVGRTIHIRVYATCGGATTEWYWDGNCRTRSGYTGLRSSVPGARIFSRHDRRNANPISHCAAFFVSPHCFDQPTATRNRNREK